MNKINNLLKILKNEIEKSNMPEHDFSSEIEDYILDNFWEIEKENHNIAMFLNDDVLDICEQTETGLENTNFKNEIKEAYKKLLEMINIK